MCRIALLRWIACCAAWSLLAGCSGRARPSDEPRLLTTEDFIADPSTMPTTRPASPTVPDRVAAPASAPSSTQSPASARAGVGDVKVEAGPPALAPKAVAAADPALLIDAKIGEINGRPIRVHDLFDQHGDRLAAAAKTRTFTPSDWMTIGQQPPKENRRCSRAEWLTLAQVLFAGSLNGILQDELLAAEARATMRPESKQGLRAFVAEATDIRRRSLGGSQAELEKQLSEKKQNEQSFGRDIEAQMLIRIQLEERVENRTKANWKDVKRYYERNRDVYQPPAIARFRLIDVGADQTESVERIQKALDGGEPFAQVAALPINEYNAAEGGLVSNGKTQIRGPYEQAEPFSIDAWNSAVRTLAPGQHTAKPISRKDRAGKERITWLCLESLTSASRSLGDPEVQLSITDRLNQTARQAGIMAYINRLVRRATFSDLDVMTRRLVDIAGERYWPAGS